MKRLALIGMLALSLFLMTGFVYAEVKLGYVDSERLIMEYGKAKEYKEVLEKKQKDFEKTREEKLDGIKKLQDKLSLLSEEEKEAQRGELEDKVAELQDFDRNAQQDFRKEMTEKDRDISEDVRAALKKYAKENNLSIIFDSRLLLYQDENLDITKQILDILNKQ